MKESGSWVTPPPLCLSHPQAPPTEEVSLELEQLREERNRLDAEVQLSAHIIQQEVGRAREQGTPGRLAWVPVFWLGQSARWGLGAGGWGRGHGEDQGSLSPPLPRGGGEAAAE